MRTKSNVMNVSVLAVLLSPSFLLWTVEAMKHSYYANNEHRSLIGPLGTPFGFLDTGFYNLTVSDFKLTIGEYEEGFSHYNDDYDLDDFTRRKAREEETQRKLNEALEGVRGVGFLLKRFEDEEKFNHYMKWISANSTRCIFDPFLDPFEDDVFLGDDDTVDNSDGYGEVENAGETGIFLNMKPVSRWGPSSPFVTYEFKTGEAGLYFLMYQICPPPTGDIHSNFELDFHFSNLDVFGNESYLSSGEMVLPHMYFYFSLLYSLCLFLWTRNIRKIREGGPGIFDDASSGQPIVYPIHHLMTVLLVLKTCSIFFESIRYHYLRVSGKTVLWSAVYYTFSFMKGTILFTVILLIGTGWSFVKPFLSNRERIIVRIILGLQVVNNIAIVVLTQQAEGELSFDNWTGILHMVDILCCCAVLLPIVWQLNALEKNIEQTSGDNNGEEIDQSNPDSNDDTRVTEDEFDEAEEQLPQDSRLAEKLKLFRGFYLMVISYIYITRIVVYLFATMLNYKHLWLKEFVVEFVTIIFYVRVGMQFRPMGENPYLTTSVRGRRETGTISETEMLTL